MPTRRALTLISLGVEGGGLFSVCLFVCLLACLFSGFFFFSSVVVGLRKSEGLRTIQCYVEKCGFWLVVVVLLCVLQ